MSILSKLHDNRVKARREKVVKASQKNAEMLSEKLFDLYKNTAINSKQRAEIVRLRAEHGEKQKPIIVKQRELAEEYMRKEISVIEDLDKKFGYEVGTYVNQELSKLTKL